MLAAALGWLGTGGTLLAYALLSKGRLSSQSRRYAVLNTAGGLSGGIAAALYGAWPSAVSNFAWAALGLGSMVRLYRIGHSDRRRRLGSLEVATCAN